MTVMPRTPTTRPLVNRRPRRPFWNGFADWLRDHDADIRVPTYRRSDDRALHLSEWCRPSGGRSNGTYLRDMRLSFIVEHPDLCKRCATNRRFQDGTAASLLHIYESGALFARRARTDLSSAAKHVQVLTELRSAASSLRYWVHREADAKLPAGVYRYCERVAGDIDAFVADHADPSAEGVDTARTEAAIRAKLHLADTEPVDTNPVLLASAVRGTPHSLWAEARACWAIDDGDPAHGTVLRAPAWIIPWALRHAQAIGGTVQLYTAPVSDDVARTAASLYRPRESSPAANLVSCVALAERIVADSTRRAS